MSLLQSCKILEFIVVPFLTFICSEFKLKLTDLLNIVEKLNEYSGYFKIKLKFCKHCHCKLQRIVADSKPQLDMYPKNTVKRSRSRYPVIK